MSADTVSTVPVSGSPTASADTNNAPISKQSGAAEKKRKKRGPKHDPTPLSMRHEELREQAMGSADPGVKVDLDAAGVAKETLSEAARALPVAEEEVGQAEKQVTSRRSELKVAVKQMGYGLMTIPGGAGVAKLAKHSKPEVAARTLLSLVTDASAAHAQPLLETLRHKLGAFDKAEARLSQAEQRYKDGVASYTTAAKQLRNALTALYCSIKRGQARAA